MAVETQAPLLDEAKQREILAIVSVGCSRSTAARYVGCHVDVIRRAALADPKFADQLQQAEARLEFLHMQHINTAAADARYWRAAAWALERKYPDRYGPRGPGVVTAAQVSETLTDFMEILLEEVPDEDARDRIQARIRQLIETFTLAARGDVHADLAG